MSNLVKTFLKLKEKLNTPQFKKLWHLDSFNDPSQKEEILGEMPEYDLYLENKKEVYKVEEPELDFLSKEPIFTPKQTYHFLRKYNYLKYKYKRLASKDIDNLQKKKLKKIVKKLEYFKKEMMAVRTRLVCSNARLVVSIAKKWKSSTCERLDMVSAGCTGLVVAVDYFDFRREEKFVTYAFRVIEDYIRKLHHSTNKYNAINNLYDDEDKNLLDVQDFSKCSIGLSDCVELVKESLVHAKPREQEVLVYYYGLNGQNPHSLRELARKFNISSERVQQIRLEGLARIKRKLDVA